MDYFAFVVLVIVFAGAYLLEYARRKRAEQKARHARRKVSELQAQLHTARVENLMLRELRTGQLGVTIDGEFTKR